MESHAPADKAWLHQERWLTQASDVSRLLCARAAQGVAQAGLLWQSNPHHGRRTGVPDTTMDELLPL